MVSVTSSKSSKSTPKVSIISELACGAISNGIASFLLNPCDVVKLRIQAQSLPPSHPDAMYRTTIQTAQKIVREEGVFVVTRNSGLWLPGIVPSMLREASYSSFRFGLYGPLKSFFVKDESDLVGKILSGASSGSIGSFLAVPTDRLKIRMQREAGRVGGSGLYETGLFKGRKQTYPSMNFVAGFAKMWREEGGITGLWKGWQPTVCRAAALAGAQLSSYDHTKHVLKSNSVMDDGFGLHIVASLVAGVAALVTTQPFDTIKSKVMALDGEIGGPKGVVDAVKTTARLEGLKGFYRGSLASYLRFGPHFIIAFPLWEQVRMLMGLGYS
ncbi:hypothetical protein TrCOL_g1524 [Triparma columacea]|uniref:Mitochondrial carrier protein n=1 Tax=Triparma columacea TaxID=722753 RepID=A0A9W7GEU3_9STRA|nr:hypothetical protein TrCOL_g1524 [Triparma columacea]